MAKKSLFTRLKEALGFGRAEREAKIRRDERERVMAEAEALRAEAKATKDAATRRSMTKEAKDEYLALARERGWLNNGRSAEIRGSSTDVGQLVRLADDLINAGVPEYLITISELPNGRYSLAANRVS